MKVSITKKSKSSLIGYVQGLKETITLDKDFDIKPYFNDGWDISCKLDEYGNRTAWIVSRFHKIAQSDENIRILRNSFNKVNPAYAICVCCGKSLHENNKQSHYDTPLGIMGDECYGKLMTLL